MCICTQLYTYLDSVPLLFEFGLHFESMFIVSWMACLTETLPSPNIFSLQTARPKKKEVFQPPYHMAGSM